MKFSPINRIPCKWWRHKTYKKAIKIIPKNKKDKKKAKALTDLLNYKINQTQECMVHQFNYAIFKNLYRLYRRGKNRCKNCGVKTNVP